MKPLSFCLALSLLALSELAAASDAELRKYCEDAAVVVQVPAEQREAYIASCIEERRAELAEEK